MHHPMSIIRKKSNFNGGVTNGRKRTDTRCYEKAGEPLNAGKIAELTGLDRKVVDKTMAAMKKDGSIVSPVRCKWEPAEK